MNTEPVIWTNKGNLPVALLVYATRWEDTETYTKLIETYALDGEIVRESAHVLAKQGMFSEIFTPSL